MIFASDPQLPWWREGKGGVCVAGPADDYEDCVLEQGRQSNQDLISAMNSVTNLGSWPLTGLSKDAGTQITRPEGTIINGDLTEFWHEYQKELYDELYGNLGYQIYPGLGNHDYEGNADDPNDPDDDTCTYNPIYHPDTNRCAKEAIWWMASQISGIPHLVRHDAPGFVAVENAGGYNIRFRVTWRLNGSPDSETTDEYEAGQWRTVKVPAGATDVRVRIEGVVFVATDSGFDLRWTTLRSETLSSPAAVCYETTGTAAIDDQDTARQGCGGTAFPDGSSGSLAYSFDIGNYHFVQLQNWPGYAAAMPAVTTFEDVLTFGLRISPGFNVMKPYAWLRRDLDLATDAGKSIILNMHDAEWLVRDLTKPAREAALQADRDAFADAIRDQNVVGVFAGHIHQYAGQRLEIANGRRSDIPVFYSGSAECRTFLYVDFHARHYNVAVVNASGGAPSFLASDWTCDTFDPYDSNRVSSVLRTYDFNRGPAIQELTVSAPPVEGRQLVFTALISEADTDELTYTWDFGDGSTPEFGRGVSGVFKSRTHVYTDSSDYRVRFTVEDEFGAQATQVLDISVANVAPALTAVGGSVDENGVATVSGTLFDQGAADVLTLTIDWGDGTPAEAVTYSLGTEAFARTHQYLDDDPTGTSMDGVNVSLTLADDELASTGAGVVVTVRNVPPTFTATGSTIDEDGMATVSGVITDPGTRDTFTLTVDWGEGDPVSSSYPAGTTAYSATHRYRDDDPTGTPADGYAVALELADDDGGSASATATVTVNNVSPSLTATGSTIDENGVAEVSGTITDPGTRDPLAVTIDWGEGEPVRYSYPAGTTVYSETHQYLDDNPTGTPADIYAITVGAADDDGGTGTAATTVTVNNVAPVATIETVTDELGSVVGTGAPVVLVRQAVRLTAGASDKGTHDTRTASVAWDDGSSTDLGALSGPESVTHRFAAPGTYKVALSVVDDDTGKDVDTWTVRVVGAADAISKAVEMLRTIAVTASPAARRDLDRAIAAAVGNNGGTAANGALDGLVRGNPYTALLKLDQMVTALLSADQADGALDLGIVLRLIGLTAKSIATDAVDQAAANAGRPSDARRVDEARVLLAGGNTELVAGHFQAAVAAYRDSVRTIQNLVAAP